MSDINKSKKILFIDEDQVSFALLKVRFENAKYKLFATSCVKNALELAIKECPDLILLSDRVSLSHCLAFCRVTKDSPETSSIPIVILLSNNKNEQELSTLGLNAIIKSPYDGDEILNCIRKILIGKILDERFKTDEVNDANFVDKIKRILIFEHNSDLVKFMMSQLKREHRFIDVAVDEKCLVDKAVEIEPNMILMNVETQSVSALEIIKELNDVLHLEMKIFLYMYFRKNASADKSELHYFYRNCLKDVSSKVRFPLYYWGVFDKESFKLSAERFLTE